MGASRMQAHACTGDNTGCRTPQVGSSRMQVYTGNETYRRIGDHEHTARMNWRRQHDRPAHPGGAWDSTVRRGRLLARV